MLVLIQETGEDPGQRRPGISHHGEHFIEPKARTQKRNSKRNGGQGEDRERNPASAAGQYLETSLPAPLRSEAHRGENRCVQRQKNAEQSGPPRKRMRLAAERSFQDLVR